MIKLISKTQLIVFTIFFIFTLKNINTSSAFCISYPYSDTIPNIIYPNEYDILGNTLILESAKKHRHIVPPQNMEQWANRKVNVKQFIIKKTKVKYFENLPLDFNEHKSQHFENFILKNITFQTRPGTYSTANLYIPDSQGKHPAILVMMGHARNGKFYDNYQLIGQDLAKNGYVALLVDPWGAGERSTTHLEFEYHGAHMGGHLMNIGETLMGMQLTDNMRAIDLLYSLDYVDKNKIGATGASGGGNQTMWLTALDERVKAAVPVASVGTFDSYIMNSNCICELLPDGLTYIEESEVLGLIAPRKLSIFNAIHENNKAFYPSEMLKSYKNAVQIFKLYNAETNISYQLFNSPHGYYPEQRKAMIKWFNENLLRKIDTVTSNYGEDSPLPQKTLQVFDKNSRNSNISTTEQYCRNTGMDLLQNIDFKNRSKEKILRELSDNFSINSNAKTYKIVNNTTINTNWTSYLLQTSEKKELNLLIKKPNKTDKFIIILNSSSNTKEFKDTVNNYIKAGYGVVLTDLTGLGQNSSVTGKKLDSGLPNLHTVSRSMHWLAKPMINEWIKEIICLSEFLNKEFKTKSIHVHASKELGVSSILASLFTNKITEITTVNTPISYIVKDLKAENIYSLAIHIPGIINWGDLPLAIAISSAKIKMFKSKDIIGKELSNLEIQDEYAKIVALQKIYNKNGTVSLFP